jgi:hypothetical protein
MPIPDSHLRKLEKELLGHDKRLQALEASIRAQQIEAEMHRMVVKLGRNEKLLALLGHIRENPQLARRAEEDPHALAAERGLELPEDTSFRIDTEGTARIELSAGHLRFELILDQRTGFSLGSLWERA